MIETLAYAATIISVPLHIIAVVLAYKAYRLYKGLAKEKAPRENLSLDRYPYRLDKYRGKPIRDGMLGGLFAMLIFAFAILMVVVLGLLQSAG